MGFLSCRVNVFVLKKPEIAKKELQIIRAKTGGQEQPPPPHGARRRTVFGAA
jgi:hypothetical protein